MKKISLVSIAAICLVFAACNKPDNPVQENGVELLCSDPSSLSNGEPGYLCLNPQTDKKALALYFMSTDCPGCGSWGTDLFHDLLEENKGKVVPMQVHIKYSDPFIVPGLSDSLTKLYYPNYTPFNMIEDYPVTNRFQVNYNLEDAKQKAAVKIDDIISKAHEVSPALNWKLHYSEIEIHYGVRFEQNSDAQYSFGIYVVEDSLEWNQAGNTKRPYYHDNTIRAAVAGAFGPSLNSEPVKAGQTKLGILKTPLIGYWKKEDLHLLGVVWKLDKSGKRSIVNAISFKP